jgi:hypothetical protein
MSRHLLTKKNIFRNINVTTFCYRRYEKWCICLDTLVKALYAISNWVFIEIIETGQTGFVPIYCLRLSDQTTLEATSQNNLSLLNVSIYEKSRSIVNTSTPPSPGHFISSIGPCHFNIEQTSLTYSRQNKSGTYTRSNKDQSNLSRQISNISLHAYDHDAYGTLNLTPCKSLSFSVLDSEPIIYHSNSRLRVIENYQRQFIGDISVLESEVVILVNTTQSDTDWRFVRRGDGRQGYIPKHIVVLDKNFNWKKNTLCVSCFVFVYMWDFISQIRKE